MTTISEAAPRCLAVRGRTRKDGFMGTPVLPDTLKVTPSLRKRTRLDHCAVDGGIRNAACPVMVTTRRSVAKVGQQSCEPSAHKPGQASCCGTTPCRSTVKAVTFSVRGSVKSCTVAPMRCLIVLPLSW
jgi:hypothetical protein